MLTRSIPEAHPETRSGKPVCAEEPVADVAQISVIVVKSSCLRLDAALLARDILADVKKRASERSSLMATSSSQPQQGGSNAPQQQQQGQQPGGTSQQAGQPIFRDWASI
jgi:hypothetical protein